MLKVIKEVYLPLYSTKSNEFEPGEKSGINQWNASGRPRDYDEAYIPVPSWIHNKIQGFFPNNKIDLFTLELPNGTLLNAKMCQDGQKAIMTDPNSDLGKWLLRDVLDAKEKALIDRAHLVKKGIDSVKITKLSHTKYKIEPAILGAFESFKKLY